MKRTGAALLVSTILAGTIAASTQGHANDASSEQLDHPVVSTDTPLQTIRDIFSYFHTPANVVQIQVPSDKTHYAWQNMSGFQYTMQIERDGPISELPARIDPAIGEISFTRPGMSPETVNQHLDTATMDGLLVLHKGDVVFERYTSMRPFDKHQWFSSGKVIAGTMVELLASEGKIDVKKPVSDYVKELKGSDWDKVTVEETLDMATGLDSTEHEEPNDDARTNPERGWYKWAVSIGLFEDKDNLNQSPFDVLRGMKKVKPGHTAFEYNSINTFVLELIVNEVTGKTINEVFGDRVWRKMGAQNDAFVGVTKYGLGNSWGFTNSTLRDMGRFAMLFSPSWNKVSKEQIIPDSLIDTIQNGGKPEIYLNGFVGREMQASFPDIKGLANRYQWDIVFPDGDFYKGGVGGQGIYISPSTDTVVVWFSTGKQQEEIMARAIVQTLAKK
ncbi:serine hydrolase [Tropicimonas sp. IMCC34043]|uniref:serine hydrolase domain-containing protein n=1 Tax=Tropicimonas sp. IMCC34043 TaxID=2248760 RepID=UPI001300A2F6|nr:serine hydrolase domain-containing protein [Tropicimonas sp. IMCC34043]